MEESEHLLSTIKNGIQKVILNRPKKRNAITSEVRERDTYFQDTLNIIYHYLIKFTDVSKINLIIATIIQG